MAKEVKYTPVECPTCHAVVATATSGNKMKGKCELCQTRITRSKPRRNRAGLGRPLAL